MLATIYGVPKEPSPDARSELHSKNRIVWNRYFAAQLDEETRAKLLQEKRHPAEELRPFSPKELEELATAFAERCKKSGKDLTLPESAADIDFSNVEFEVPDRFSGYLFPGAARFNGATFSFASFQGATFSDAWFEGATFSDVASFTGATFSYAWFARASFPLARFNGATFSGGASFEGATFSWAASFDGATFSGWASFKRATFSWAARFNGATLSHASFDGASFSGEALFRRATFFGKADSGGATSSATSFVNSEMKSETSFEGAKFLEEPPKFFNAKLHQGTVWRGIAWPTPKKRVDAGKFIDAYACLKLEMDRLKKHDDELDFFARELQSRRVLFGPARGLPIALYGGLSSYGRSYIRPLVGLFVLVAMGAGVLWYFGPRTYAEALGLSAASTLNVFGFRRDFNLSIDTLLPWLKVFIALQTIVGAIFLFLFGLGIRNKFRMK